MFRSLNGLKKVKVIVMNVYLRCQMNVKERMNVKLELMREDIAESMGALI
jgi:hypothetical protein